MNNTLLACGNTCARLGCVKLACQQWSASCHNRPDRAAGAALKLHAMSHSCYVIQCVRPGRVVGPTGRAGPGFRPDHRVRVRVWVMARACVGFRVRVSCCSSIVQFFAIFRNPHCVDAEWICR